MGKKFHKSILKERLDSEDTVLVHPTSFERTRTLLNHGSLKREDFNSFHLEDYGELGEGEGYLTFIPYQRSMDLHPLALMVKALSWNEAISLASQYAKLAGFTRTLITELGYRPKTFSLQNLLEGNGICIARLKEEVELKGKKKISFSTDTLKYAQKREGVLLGINKEILYDFKEYHVNTSGDRVLIHFPQRKFFSKVFHGKYVNGIVPLGEIEKNFLDIYFEGKL